jgi:hypothetical protein
VSTALSNRNLGSDAFQRPDFETASRIKISSDDPLAFALGDTTNRQLMAIIISGVSRYSAKDSGGQWHNFNNKEELDDYMEENPAAQRVQKYQLKLLLPNDDRQWLFDLPLTSSIAFWQYKESLEKAEREINKCVSRLSIVREHQKKDQSVVYSRVKFEYAGEASAEVMALQAGEPDDKNYDSFWRSARAMGFEPKEVLQILGVKDLQKVDLLDAIHTLEKHNIGGMKKRQQSILTSPIALSRWKYLCDLELKDSRGAAANIPAVVGIMFGKAYGATDEDPLPFSQLTPVDQEAVIGYVEKAAKSQGIEINYPPEPESAKAADLEMPF